MKKMTTFIINRCVKKINDVPVLRFEDIYLQVEQYVKESSVIDFDILTDVVILYSRDTMLTPKQRKQYSMEARSARGGKLAGELIHNAAISAVKSTQELLKVTNPRVLSKVKENKIKTINSLLRHMREDTSALLGKANQGRPFVHELSREKFLQFLELPVECTIREVSEKLGVSKTTAAQFREIKTKLEE